GILLSGSAGHVEQCRSGPDRGCTRPTTGDRLPALHYTRAGELDFARAVDAVDPASRTETFRRALERAVRPVFISTRNASRLREHGHGRPRCRPMGAGDLALRPISATWRPWFLRPCF